MVLDNLPSRLDGLTDDEVTKVIEKLKVDDQLEANFRKYTEERGLTLTDSSWEESRSVIRNFIRQELILLLVGDEASYRIALELDKQVQAAIDKLPRAAALLRPIAEPPSASAN